MTFIDVDLKTKLLSCFVESATVDERIRVGKEVHKEIIN